MYADEYLVCTVDKIRIAVNCLDVLNVYRQKLHVTPLTNQHEIFLGITSIANMIMPVIDLRKRAGVCARNQGEAQNIVTFQTSMTKKIAVVVDEIIGMKSVKSTNLHKPSMNHHNQYQNVHLLFPMVAILDDGSMLHILDSTYLDKTEPIAQESGGLELF